MNTIDNEDLILKTLQSTFPQADHIRIIEKSMGCDNFNFTSEIVSLTVDCGKNKKSNLKHLILKIPDFKNPFYSNHIQLNVYKREAYTYEKVLPYINKLLVTSITPIHYYTTDSNILVLENLAKQGYKLAPGDKFFNAEQFLPILKTLAKFHAASCKIRQQHPHLLTDNIFEENRLSVEPQLSEGMIPVVCEIMKRSGSSHLIPKMTAVWSTMSHENGIKQKIHSKNFSFVVLNHGDYRRENLMMKYDDDQQATDIKIIDFQLCTWSTPVQDFLYSMITSVQIDLIEEHFDNFVNLYVQYLQETLLELGCNESYDKTDFMADYDKIKLFMNLALLSLCCILSNSDNPENPDAEGSPAVKIQHDENCVRIISFWLHYLEKVGALDASYAKTT